VHMQGGDRIAGGEYFDLLADHLGSITVEVDENNEAAAQELYAPWGETRFASGAQSTDYRYTGQYSAEVGLYFYNSRWYDPYLNHWTQPDTIVPDPYNPLDWNRYSYVRYNPIKNTDPTGHMVADDLVGGCGLPGCTINPIPQNPIQPPSIVPDIPDISLPDVNDKIVFPPLQSNGVYAPKIGSKCTRTNQCISDWEIPGNWDLNPRNPDYSSLSISVGELYGITLIITRNRYGSVYGNLGVNIGKSITPLSGSLMNGWIGDPLDDSIPTQGEMDEFLSGFGANASLGVLGGGGLSWNPYGGYYANHFSSEVGIVLIAQMGISIGYSTGIPFFTTR